MPNQTRKQKGLLISDFNVDNFAAYLRKDSDPPQVDINTAPHGQPAQVLMQGNLECWLGKPNFAVVWTQPQAVIESFSSALAYRRPSVDIVLSQVDDFCSLLVAALDYVESVFVPTWASRPLDRGFGMLDMRAGFGISDLLMRMNIRLSDNLKEARGIYLLNAQQWVSCAGKSAYGPKLWYMAKVPFGHDVFFEAAKDIKAALRGLSGAAKKLVVLDLDDTLWGGIVGDVGWQNLRLGGHDPVGEAFVDFQLALKSLTNRGVLLAIVSKNEEAIVLEAISAHPEMVLKLEDFAGWRINWRDKAANITDLSAELNLGVESVVFIDDSPFERGRVREALPEVFVPEWPEDRMRYSSYLQSLRCFDTPVLSSEDVERAKMYSHQRERDNLKHTVGSLDDWLKSLAICIRIEELNDGNLQRTVQLLNKTNQMNLSTRRLTERELWDWVSVRGRNLWTFHVSDKFGNSGLCGIASLEASGTVGWVADFVLSCRVMGRGVEQGMLASVLEYSRSVGLKEVCARFVPTPKNGPCLRFLEENGFHRTPENVFSWNVEVDYCAPAFLRFDRDVRSA